MSRANIPAAAIHATGPAEGRKPSSSATAMTSTPLIIVRIRLPVTWPVSTDPREMAMVRNRGMMPVCMSVHTFTAVASAEKPAVITRMPGARKLT